MLAESGERSLVEAHTEGLGVGFAWKVWGGPWLGKSEQGSAQTEPGCQATHRPGSPQSPKGQSSRPESVASPPHPALPLPQAQRHPWRGWPPALEAFGAQDTVAGSWMRGARGQCSGPVCSPHARVPVSTNCGMACAPRVQPPIYRQTLSPEMGALTQNCTGVRV